MKDTCKNCGAWHGLHQAETMRCPHNGQEARIGSKQIWDHTTYQEDDLLERIEKLEAELKKYIANAEAVLSLSDDKVTK